MKLWCAICFKKTYLVSIHYDKSALYERNQVRRVIVEGDLVLWSCVTPVAVLNI